MTERYFDTWVHGSKKSKFIIEQEAIGLLSSLEIKVPLSKVPLEGSLLFLVKNEWNSKRVFISRI